jgi:hypothetical protein
VIDDYGRIADGEEVDSPGLKVCLGALLKQKDEASVGKQPSTSAPSVCPISG